MLFFHSISFAMALWVRKCYFKKTKKPYRSKGNLGFHVWSKCKTPGTGSYTEI